MRPFEELFRESSALHGHHCAGQVLGVRMAMVGCREVGIDEPRGCKKLIVYVEMDRCATDAVQAVTGCSLGKRTLKFLDYGKMAATFINTETNNAVRVLAKDDARSHASAFAPDATNPREAQKQAYAVMPEELLFGILPTRVEIPEENLPGFGSPRVSCDVYGEGINLRREIRRAGQTLCIPCGQTDGASAQPARSSAHVLHIVGLKKVGKTTVIAKLIVELIARGYRVGTVKHHHSGIPAEVDTVGTDTWRHRQAGAATVALMTSTHVALFRDAVENDSLEKLLREFGGHDIVLVEGFHEEPGPKIEVLSERGESRLCLTDQLVIATVGGNSAAVEVPNFAPHAIGPLADFVERKFFANHHLQHSRRLSLEARQFQCGL
ncbi:MAG: molybdopterin-guanine dinucleotide biosynthesis protein B [Candidatus Binatia bacterium]